MNITDTLIYIRTMYIYISEINLNYIQLYREEKIDFTKKKINESNTNSKIGQSGVLKRKQQ
jgi:hypothetical protein